MCLATFASRLRLHRIAKALVTPSKGTAIFGDAFEGVRVFLVVGRCWLSVIVVGRAIKKGNETAFRAWDRLQVCTGDPGKPVVWSLPTAGRCAEIPWGVDGGCEPLL